jgi:oligopeptide/dipeptide ABC transporter ATP-binding protein
MSLVLISHDLALVGGIADRVAVMYAGQSMECGPPGRLFEDPRHPYTRALLRSTPEANRGRTRLVALAGTVPHPSRRPAGCVFAPRCDRAGPACARERPALATLADGTRVACVAVDELRSGAGAS